MLRLIPPSSRILRRLSTSTSRPEKIECFVDGQKVLVDPGTTVLQVNTGSIYNYIMFFAPILY